MTLWHKRLWFPLQEVVWLAIRSNRDKKNTRFPSEFRSSCCLVESYFSGSRNIKKKSWEIHDNSNHQALLCDFNWKVFLINPQNEVQSFQTGFLIKGSVWVCWNTFHWNWDYFQAQPDVFKLWTCAPCQTKLPLQSMAFLPEKDSRSNPMNCVHYFSGLIVWRRFAGDGWWFGQMLK